MWFLFCKVFTVVRWLLALQLRRILVLIKARRFCLIMGCFITISCWIMGVTGILLMLMVGTMRVVWERRILKFEWIWQMTYCIWLVVWTIIFLCIVFKILYIVSFYWTFCLFCYIQVFSFLDHRNLCHAAMVCRQWRAASAHEDFWRCLNFEYRNISLEQCEFLICIISLGSS